MRHRCQSHIEAPISRTPSMPVPVQLDSEPPIFTNIWRAPGIDASIAQVAKHLALCYTQSIERSLLQKLKGGAGYEQKARLTQAMHLTDKQCVLLICHRMHVCRSLEKEHNPPGRDSTSSRPHGENSVLCSAER